MRTRLRASVAVALVVAPVALLVAACSRPPEQQFLNAFFRAARVRDNESVARMSAVEFDPREHGEVTRFRIVSISEERRTPLDFQPLIEAHQQAAEREAEIRRQRVEFETLNRPALEAIAKMEREEGAKFTPTQQKLKAEWDKWREDALAGQKATSAARAALNNAIGPAEASLSQPGQPEFSPDKFKGELIAKDVTLDADVRKDGETTQKTIVVTIQRVEGTLDGAQRTGRPIIARIQVD